MSKVQRFFSYLGFSDTSINAEQLLTLICILNEEKPTTLRGTTVVDVLNEVLDIYIYKIEHYQLDEQKVIERLSNV